MNKKRRLSASPVMPETDGADGARAEASLRAEIEKRQSNQRLTPAHRRIVQVLLDNEAEIGFLSSMELAELANVSQPSVTRFASALGFSGFSDMRKCLRSFANANAASTPPKASANKYQSAVEAEAQNIAALAQELSDIGKIQAIGAALAASKPLVVLGIRASANLATHFAYFAAKVHPDVRLIAQGGSMVEDLLEQAHLAGAKTVLAFAMPLYPRETVDALTYSKQLGMQVIAITDPGFNDEAVDMKITARIHSSLVFDSSAAASVIISVLLDAMCDAVPEYAERRLEYGDKSSTKRKVFVR